MENVTIESEKFYAYTLLAYLDTSSTEIRFFIEEQNDVYLDALPEFNITMNTLVKVDKLKEGNNE